MKIIGHYSQRGEIEADPNLQALIEHGEHLLNEEYLFESPFKDNMSPTSEVDPNDFDLSVDDIGLEDDFDLPERLSGFISKIREEDKGKCESGCKCKCLSWLIILFLIVGAVAPFFVFSKMWWNERTYNNTENACGILVQEDSNRVVSSNSKKYYDLFYFVMQDGDSIQLIDNMQLNQQRYYKKGGHGKGYGAFGKEKTTVHSFDWLLILFGIILSLALIATLIVLAYHIHKRNELEHEECRQSFEHQNKMINEYASYLYSIKRVRIQQCETLLSLKQQYALQQMDFQQREMDMRQKEQDNAWRHKENHLNAVKEYLLNFHYEMNSDKKQNDDNSNNNNKGNDNNKKNDNDKGMPNNNKIIINNNNQQ